MKILIKVLFYNFLCISLYLLTFMLTNNIFIALLPCVLVWTVQIAMILKTNRSEKKNIKKKTEYELYSDNLLKRVKKEGILVETMDKDSFTPFIIRKQYKKDLGSITKSNWRGDITNVYSVYEDFDGSVKYYDYPQSTRKERKRKLKQILN